MTQFERLSNFCHERDLPFWRTLYEIQRGFLRDKIPGGREIINFRTHKVGPNRLDKLTKKIFTEWRWDRLNLTLEQANEAAIEYFFSITEKD